MTRTLLRASTLRRMCLRLGMGTSLALSLGCAQNPRPERLDSRLLGDYITGRDTVYIRENGGRLEVVTKRGVLQKQQYAQGTFRITPQRPVEELREAALKAKPPAETTAYHLVSDFVELNSLDKTIRYDIRYATTNNFMGAVFYSSAHAFLQRPAAEAVARVNAKLKQYGYGLLIHDAYRPWYVTKMFWDATPDSLHDFVADPAYGSRHNRGAAVDLSMYDLKTGQPVAMPSSYDEFSERAFPSYPGGTTQQRQRRDLLRSMMEAEGFTVYNFEWWHFDYRNWRQYPINNFTFEAMPGPRMRPAN